MKTLLGALAAFVAEAPLQADAQTLSMLRDGVVDVLGCMHAGARTEVGRRSRKAVASMGAQGDAPLVGADMDAARGAARPQAAFLNAVAAHALDFDDWELPGNTHPSAVLLPVLLALAGEETSGMEFCRAYLAGFEVIVRLGEALNFEMYAKGWHSTATLGAVGAAAAAARLAGGSAAETTSALSFAASAAVGYTCQFGSHAKPVQAGFAARAGIEAWGLAAAGLTARPDVLEHERGMAALLAGVPGIRLQAALARLGDKLALTEHGLVLKPWPSCGYTHRMTTCALRLRGQVDGRDIAQIDLHLPDFHADILPFAQPQSRSEACFSLPFAVAAGLARGGLTLADIDAEIWREPDIAALMEKTRLHPFRPRRPGRNYAEEDPDRMVVTLRGGERLEDSCAFPLGTPQTPLPRRQLREKFAANAGGESAGWLARLDEWPQSGRVLALMTGGSASP